MTVQLIAPKLAQQSVYTLSGQPFRLETCLARSGEGEVWQTQSPNYLAKLYRQPTPARIRKLQVMVAHPPTDPNQAMGHTSFAWPLALLHNSQGEVLGFLMQAIAHSVDLLDVYHPLRRQRTFTRFDWRYLHVTGLNIVSMVWAIHQAGYVLGDMKPQNILVNDHALPAFIDTDSFQIRDPETQELFPCLVGSEGFTPPELLSADLSQTPQTMAHDYFRLGVILYHLLFGDHPFKGQWMGQGDSPSPTELVRRGLWPYLPNNLLRPSPLTIPLGVVHPQLQRCFQRCFTDGFQDPRQRPTPREWMAALQVALADLKPCRRVKTHRYSQHYGRCYWCERQKALGLDIFSAPLSERALAIQHFKQQVHTTLHQQLERLPAPKKSPTSPPTTPPQGTAWSTVSPTRLALRTSFSPTQSPPPTATVSLPRGSGVRTIRPLKPSLDPLVRSLLLSRSWQAVALVGLGTLALLGCATWISHAHMNPEDLKLTGIGIGLSTLLVLGCVVLMKLTERQPQ
jgi:DNA-binding helix-hairpin-helix protein with protein kinase domain